MTRRVVFFCLFFAACLFGVVVCFLFSAACLFGVVFVFLQQHDFFGRGFPSSLAPWGGGMSFLHFVLGGGREPFQDKLSTNSLSVFFGTIFMEIHWGLSLGFCERFSSQGFLYSSPNFGCLYM